MARHRQMLTFVGLVVVTILGYAMVFKMYYTEIATDISVSKALYRQRQIVIKKFMNTYLTTHAKRLNHTQHMCKKHKKELPKMKKRPIFLVNEKHKLVYCQTPKAGTVSWCRIFLVLSGYKNYSEVVQMSAENVSDAWKLHVPRLSHFPPEKQEEIMSNYTKIMIVRNPLTRLLSAFNDKLVAKNATDYKLSIQRTLSQQLLQEFRAGNTTGKYDPTFSEFISMIVSMDYIDNIHWRNMHSICFPCEINYNVIGRFENIENDSNYILRLVGSNIRFPKPSQTHFTNSSSEEKLKRNYATIPRSDLRSIYRKYKYDFSLFDYDKLIPL